ncbi:nitroreductase/quinone reductase family protein [Fodinicola acaciae]|uniref:nitroreductase/quinone reductase family protein n=1 Tax=Fodinicola acaciae TaxID=2681555 RepID=UPI0013CF6C03|nr:nitroreductase/quinone reductase family protein [Fodinicola acaciae]
MAVDLKRRADLFHRYLANPLALRTARFVRGQAVLETIGRVSGQPRRTPVGGKVVGGSFWMVSGDGHRAQYVRNIAANPRVRVQIRGRWHAGVARLLPDDDPRARLRTLPAFNSRMVRMLGVEPLTVRIDLKNE